MHSNKKELFIFLYIHNSYFHKKQEKRREKYLPELEGYPRHNTILLVKEF
jgi:hypothetical protein